jgi:phosphoglycerol transferase MdoB-like AlkP superfamily enzyme
MILWGLIAVTIILLVIWFSIKDKVSFDTSCNVGISLIASICLLIVALLALGGVYIDTPAQMARNRERYNALVYQVENKMWEHEVDVSKKTLVDQIVDWNSDYASHEANRNNIWINIFVTDTYNGTAPIDLKGVN